jgi:preprotein translocase subunit YajC
MIPFTLLEDGGSAGGTSQFILLGGVLLIMWLVVFLPERKARKKKEAMLSAIKKNDRVLLTSGMYATVAAVNETELTVRFDDGQTRVRLLRSAVGQVITPESEADSKAAAS